MLEKITAFEVEDEDGNVSILKIRRVVSQDMRNIEGVYSNQLTLRPGGMVVAARHDARTITTADDAIADAAERSDRQYAEMQERGHSEARTGGEGAILPDEVRTPARRGRRGPRGTQAAAEQSQQEQAAAAAPPAA